MSQPLSPHRAIAGRVKWLRKERRGWSAQRLADEMAKVGIPWDRSIVANLENGRRAGISVEEWLALALVLNVAPIHLIIPTDGDETDRYAVAPGRESLAWEAREWVRGRYPLQSLGQDPRSYFSEVPADEFRIDQDSADRVTTEFRDGGDRGHR